MARQTIRGLTRALHRPLIGRFAISGGGGGIFSESWAESESAGNGWTSFEAASSGGFTATSDGASVAIIPEDLTADLGGQVVSYQFDLDTLSSGSVSFSIDSSGDVTQDDADVGIVTKATGGTKSGNTVVFTSTGAKIVVINTGSSQKLKPKFKSTTAGQNIVISNFTATVDSSISMSSDFVTDHGSDALGIWGLPYNLGGLGSVSWGGHVDNTVHVSESLGATRYWKPADFKPDSTIFTDAMIAVPSTFGRVLTMRNRLGGSNGLARYKINGEPEVYNTGDAGEYSPNKAINFLNGRSLEVTPQATFTMKNKKMSFYFLVQLKSFPSDKVLYLMSTDNGTAGGSRLQLWRQGGIGSNARIDIFARQSASTTTHFYEGFNVDRSLVGDGWNIIQFDIDLTATGNYSLAGVKAYVNGIEITDRTTYTSPTGSYGDGTETPKMGVRGDDWSGSWYSDFLFGSLAWYDLTTPGFHEEAKRLDIVNSLLAIQGVNA